MTKQQSQMADSSLPAELAAPVRRALNGAGIQRLEQLAQQNAADISQLHGMAQTHCLSCAQPFIRKACPSRMRRVVFDSNRQEGCRA